MYTSYNGWTLCSLSDTGKTRILAWSAERVERNHFMDIFSNIWTELANRYLECNLGKIPLSDISITEDYMQYNHMALYSRSRINMDSNLCSESLLSNLSLENRKSRAGQSTHIFLFPWKTLLLTMKCYPISIYIS